MTSTSKSAPSDKPTTLADLLAAVELGAIDPQTPVIPVAATDTLVAAARADAYSKGRQRTAEEEQEAADRAERLLTQVVVPSDTDVVTLPAGVHDCAVSGCAHGSTHGPGYIPQPDRQTVLLAPCGSRVRITNRALALAGGALSCGHGDAYTVTARRTYTPRKV